MNVQPDVSKRHIGVSFGTEGHADICVWAPSHQKVELLVDKKSAVALQASERGYWKLRTTQLKPGDRYRFMLDEKDALPDPVSLSQPEGVHGASVAVNVNDFVWTDAAWNNLPLDTYIIYELHTGTFTPEGTFEAIIGKLDHLSTIGITAIEIMPVAQFPGTRNWGYDGVFPFAAQDSYGGAAGLQQLVDACHNKGLAVILDVVYNHLGPEGNYLPAYGPYFTDKYKTPWGSAINYDDAGSDAVRQYMIENALMWLRDFHFDALRLDAVHAIRDFSPVHILCEMKARVNELMQQTGRKHYLIIESDLNDPRFIEPVEQAGCGIDAQWLDDFHHALRVTAGQPRTGYYADFEGLPQLVKSYTDAYVYDGQYSDFRQKTFGRKVHDDQPACRFITFSQNHDQVGNRMMGERSSALHSFEMQKLMAATVLTSPFIPLLFMGEEWGEPQPFRYFAGYDDNRELAEAIRKGRREEFSSFHHEGEAPDPGHPDTFNRSKLQWQLPDQEPHSVMLKYYQALIALRKKHPVLHRCDRRQLQAGYDESKKTLLVHRWQEEHQVLCLANFSAGPQTIVVPAHSRQWKTLFHSADPCWNGTGTAPTLLCSEEQVTLQPESMLICTNCYV